MRLLRKLFTAPAAIYHDPQNDIMWTLNGNIAGLQMTWTEAMCWVNSLEYGGYCDWRLPTIEELWTFLHQNNIRKKMTWFLLNHFHNVEPGKYWSGDTHPTRPDCALITDFSRGKGCDEFDNKNGTFCYVWPVRDL